MPQREKETERAFHTSAVSVSASHTA